MLSRAALVARRSVRLRALSIKTTNPPPASSPERLAGGEAVFLVRLGDLRRVGPVREAVDDGLDEDVLVLLDLGLVAKAPADKQTRAVFAWL